MSNLKDYLDWRGDLTFAERPFNDLDSLVFCQLSYIDMHMAFEAENQAAPVVTAMDDEDGHLNIVQSRPQGKALPLREVVDFLDQKNALHILLADGVEKHEEYAQFSRLAAASKRFGDVILYDYEDIFDKNEQIQFCALTFRIDDKTDYIAFRGTDDSIVGWKEDFMIAFEKIPAQDAALQYLRRHLHLHPDHHYYIGGHSKGANLALYAAAQLPQKMQDQVLHVFVYDGPGLCSDVLDTSIIQRIDAKTTKVVPEYDVIGKIFEMPITDNRIVRSSGEGIMQHGILTWQLKDGGELDLVPENAPGSKWTGRVLDGWIGSVSTQDRKTFIDDFFDTMAAGGTDTFYELRHEGPEAFEKVLAQAANVSPITWNVATALPLTAAVGPEQAQKTQDRFSRFLTMLQTNRYARSAILIGGGIVCMAIPSSALPLFVGIVMTIALGTVLGYTLHEFYKSHWDLSAIQNQAYISIFSIVVYLVVIIKEGALMLISNLVFGILFLFLAYHIFQRSQTLEKFSIPWIGSLFEVALLALMAVYILIAPTGTIRMFTFICGCIFLADGIIHLVAALRDRKANKAASIRNSAE